MLTPTGVMAFTTAPTLVEVRRRTIIGRNNRCKICVKTTRMVLDTSSSVDEARNARLGIGNLWEEPPIQSRQSADTATDTPDSAIARQAEDIKSDMFTLPPPPEIPVVGDDYPSTTALPWDTTTGIQGMSYLQRRIRHSNRRKQSLRQSYIECERITELFSKTFYMGCTLLEPEKRRAVYSIYTWCRRTDDLVDGPRVSQRNRALHSVLHDWSTRLDRIFTDHEATDALDLALIDTVEKYPLLTPRPFHDMIAGMRMDVEMDRFETFDQLYLYCYRVAGTVGLMTLPIMGANEPGRRGLRAAQDAALALGIALQLTNILRDVGEDRLRGRIYLPLEDMRKFNYTEEDLQNCVLDSRYRALMRFEIARARRYFRMAEKGIPLLAPNARLPVRASLDMYSQILDVLENNGYDNFSKRAYVSKAGKVLTVPVSWMRIQDSAGWHNIANYADKFLGRRKL